MGTALHIRAASFSTNSIIDCWIVRNTNKRAIRSRVSSKRFFITFEKHKTPTASPFFVRRRVPVFSLFFSFADHWRAHTCWPSTVMTTKKYPHARFPLFVRLLTRAPSHCHTMAPTFKRVAFVLCLTRYTRTIRKSTGRYYDWYTRVRGN